MIRFIRAHGYDPGPTQRPFLAGAIAGLLATAPGALTFVGFGSFQVAADDVIRLPRAWTGGLMILAFILAGFVYGAFFQRAANDRRAGWLLGLAYGFALWIAAPIVVLPLIGGQAMAAGPAATGFLVTFLIWGLATGLLFPAVHRPLYRSLDGAHGRGRKGFGPDAAIPRRRFLRRPHWMA